MKALDKTKRIAYACLRSEPVWAVAKLAASALEKLAVGSALVGIFQQQYEGFIICAVCFALSATITALDTIR